MEGNEEGILCKKRGRPRIRRRMGECGPWRCYAPQCNSEVDAGFVSVLAEEIEIMRLIDLEGMEQEEAAAVLGVSRRTVWKDLHSARWKVTDALVHGKKIELHDCALRTEGSCPIENENLCPKSMRVYCIRKDEQDSSNQE